MLLLINQILWWIYFSNSLMQTHSTSDMLIIRHGRSRVRHSSEKDHLRWGLKAFDNLTLDSDYDNDTMNGNQSYYGNGSDIMYPNNSGEFLTTADIPLKKLKEMENVGVGNAGSTDIGSFSIHKNTGNYSTIMSANSNNIVVNGKQITPVKKKLAKKEIMANIRKNVDKGLEYLKSHAHLNRPSMDIDLTMPSMYSNNQRESLKTTTTTITGDRKPLSEHNYDATAPVAPAIPTTSTVNVIEMQPTSDILSPSSSLSDTDLSRNPIENQFSDNDNYKLQNDKPNNRNETLSKGFNSDLNKQFRFGTAQRNDNDDTSSERIKPHQNQNLNNNEVNSTENSKKIVEHQSDSDQTLNDEEIVENVDEYGSESLPNGLFSDNNEMPADGGDGTNNDKYVFNDGSVGGTVDESATLFHRIEDYGDLEGLDETSRNNRLNLIKGQDVVTKFLQIVETQHLLGSNCTAGTALNLGEGVVDRYAQDRFRVEAEIAVNRANMLTRVFKLSPPEVLKQSEQLLHASVLSMVDFDDDIFAGGHCFDWNQHPIKKGLFCPFAYRLPYPDQDASLVKDLAAEYHYLGNTSEWFFLARKNAEKVIARNEQYTKAYHLYSNSTEREEDRILSVKYEDGRWSKPYYDCGGGNIWMLTYTVPFFGHENATYFFKGTSGIDIDLRRVDIDQCPQRHIAGTTQPLNIFAGTDKCKQRTTQCEPISGLGFRRGSYKCVCRKGFYFPDTNSAHRYFNGSSLEEEYEKLMLLNEISAYNQANTYECLPCAEGCDFCTDGSPCVAALNWPMRTSILVLACAVIGFLPPAAWFTFRYQQVKVLRAASPALLRVIALGAFFIYCTSIVMYPNPSIYTCTARVWLREIGFSLTYGALMLKTWRISVIFRVRSAKAVKITDASLLKRLGVLCGCIGVALLVRTIVAPPLVVVGKTADDLKAFLCKTDWWDHTFTSMEVLFLAWGVRLCIVVRKAPSEFNESRFISMAIYNEFLLTCFLNVSMLFLQSPANPDLLYIIFFCHTQLTVTLLLALIFGSKVYLVFRSGGKPTEDTIGLGAKSSGAKFICRSQARTLANVSTATSSTAQLAANADARLSEQEALDQIRQLCNQLQLLQERAPPRGVAIATIATLLETCSTSHPLSLKPPPGKIVNKMGFRADKSTNTNILVDELYQQTENGYARIVITDDSDKAATETLPASKSVCESNHTRSTLPDKMSESKSNNELAFLNLHLECMCSGVEEGSVPTESNLCDQHRHYHRQRGENVIKGCTGTSGCCHYVCSHLISGKQQQHHQQQQQHQQNQDKQNDQNIKPPPSSSSLCCACCVNKNENTADSANISCKNRNSVNLTKCKQCDGSTSSNCRGKSQHKVSLNNISHVNTVSSEHSHSILDSSKPHSTGDNGKCFFILNHPTAGTVATTHPLGTEHDNPNTISPGRDCTFTMSAMPGTVCTTTTATPTTILAGSPEDNDNISSDDDENDNVPEEDEDGMPPTTPSPTISNTSSSGIIAEDKLNEEKILMSYSPLSPPPEGLYDKTSSIKHKQDTGGDTSSTNSTTTAALDDSVPNNNPSTTTTNPTSNTANTANPSTNMASNSSTGSSTSATGLNASKRKKQPETKLVLDLNDRSKYTKEVSV